MVTAKSWYIILWMDTEFSSGWKDSLVGLKSWSLPSYRGFSSIDSLYICYPFNMLIMYTCKKAWGRTRPRNVLALLAVLMANILTDLSSVNMKCIYMPRQLGALPLYPPPTLWHVWNYQDPWAEPESKGFNIPFRLDWDYHIVVTSQKQLYFKVWQPGPKGLSHQSSMVALKIMGFH